MKKLTKEDISKYGTKEEIEFLLEESDWGSEYKDLVSPIGHSKCVKCDGEGQHWFSKGSGTGYKHAHYIMCKNQCGIIGEKAHEPMYTKNRTYKDIQRMAITKAWENWDNGEVMDWAEFRKNMALKNKKFEL